MLQTGSTNQKGKFRGNGPAMALLAVMMMTTTLPALAYDPPAINEPEISALLPLSSSPGLRFVCEFMRFGRLRKSAFELTDSDELGLLP